MSWADKLASQEQDQRTYENDAEARRVILVDTLGNPIDPESTAESVVSVFGQSSVGTGATVTLATYTVPVNKIFKLAGGFVGGNQAGEFTYEIASATRTLIRNSGSIRTIEVNFPVRSQASAGAVINLKVKNISNRTRTFEGTLEGYTIDA